MFRYSMTQWIVGGEDIERSFKRLQACGFDDIEFAGEPEDANRAKYVPLMEKYGIGCKSICGIGKIGRDLTLPTSEAQSARQYLIDSMDLAVEVGAKTLLFLPSLVGRQGPNDGLTYAQSWDNAVENIRMVAPIAEDKGVTLAIEPINRYETFLVNTVEAACKMAREVDSPAVGVMADAFHMNIEEKNPAAAVKSAGKLLKHVHIADSNRGAVGDGHTDFEAIMRTLIEMGYEGEIAMEYMCRTSNPYLAFGMDAMTEMMDDYAMRSLKALKTIEGKLR